MTPLEEPAAIDTWQAAELLAAEHMREIGFIDATTTARGADGGIDVLARNGIAQVKFHTAPVGAPSVQQLAGIASPRRVTAVFYSLSGYTRAAVAVAEEAEVALFSYTPDGSIGQWSSEARKLQETGYFDLPQGDGTLAYDEFVDSLNVYGQRVADMIPRAEARLAEKVATWRADPRLVAGTDLNELSRTVEEMHNRAVELNGETVGQLTELFQKVGRVERLIVRLVELLGDNYRAFELQARTSQAKSTT
ncbi:restriction endonuclease [Microbacterium lacus]|uniref:restriction endonuclease n=1 Tax=Microbacterium lacus TaxID=415217 RepID=UPI00384BE30B